jgi:hypothetical protein
MIGDATLFQRADMVEAAGALSIRCSMFGQLCLRVSFLTTPPALGDRKMPMNSWNVTTAIGGK